MISFLEQSGFRNLKDFSLEFPGDAGDAGALTIVTGENGQGKSNLLEAIHLVCQGFSPRTRSLAGTIGWQAASAVLRAKTDGTERALLLSKKGPKPVKAKLDGNTSQSAGLLFGEAPVVSMAPADIALAQGAPEARRSSIDELLCHNKKVNFQLLKDYRKVLAERNAWLKACAAGMPPVGGEELFAVLTRQLAGLAARVWQERADLVRALSPLAQDFYGRLAPAETFSLAFARQMDAPDYLQKLARQASAERAVGQTLSGPHRDDVEMLLDGRPLRGTGSQGQCRSASLAWRFASISLLTQGSRAPILLLDDIFAELDAKRRQAVAGAVRASGCQAFVATPNRADLPFAGDRVLTVNAGEVV
jgi:DNA replication and repair protein RecF